MLLEGKSVYIHVPFCKKICTYCDFCKAFYNKKWASEYLRSLRNEIKDRYMEDTINTIYIGGGTPSSLDKEDLKELFDIIKIFKVREDAEFTFECNLNDITEELVVLLSYHGVNRVSIGVESFNQKNLAFLGREGSFEKAVEAINLLNKYGINNINVDLIYALPKQSIWSLKRDLKYITKLDVKHISTYSLMIEEHTVLYNRGLKPIKEELDAKMYKVICSYLKKFGFEHYEVSNFAKKGYESKHNLVYWHNEEYYGFGPGASGYIDGIRYDNQKNLTKYFSQIYVKDEEIIGDKEKMDYEIILGLRLINGINTKDFYNKYHVNIQNKYPIEKLCREKLLIHKNGNIFINPSKLYIMNEILIRMI